MISRWRLKFLEHVEEDNLFIQEVYRVLKPGGIFLMTTPNGDHLLRFGPARKDKLDYKRFYTREQLSFSLATHFRIVEIEYAVRARRWYCFGLKTWSMRQPLTTALTMIGDLISSVESYGKAIRQQARGTKKLIAIAKKSN